jgi:hypothetical protein
VIAGHDHLGGNQVLDDPLVLFDLGELRVAFGTTGLAAPIQGRGHWHVQIDFAGARPMRSLMAELPARHLAVLLRDVGLDERGHLRRFFGRREALEAEAKFGKLRFEARDLALRRGEFLVFAGHERAGLGQGCP